MTQALDISERVPYREEQRAPAATQAQTATRVDKLKMFVITFGIAFAIIYTLFERWNWPLFTYHPAVNRLDLFRVVGIPEDGPPMFWYGWLVLSAIAATAVAAVATALPRQSLQRATVFFSMPARAARSPTASPATNRRSPAAAGPSKCRRARRAKTRRWPRWGRSRTISPAAGPSGETSRRFRSPDRRRRF